MVAGVCERTNPRWLGRCEWGTLPSVSTSQTHPSSQFTESQRRFSTARCRPPQSWHVGAAGPRKHPLNPTWDFVHSCLPAAARGPVQGPVLGADARAGKMQDDRQITKSLGSDCDAAPVQGQTEPGRLAGQVPGRLCSAESRQVGPEGRGGLRSPAISTGCCPPRWASGRARPLGQSELPRERPPWDGAEGRVPGAPQTPRWRSGR